MGSIPDERKLKVERVAIIGAGPSGLAAAKYLLAEKAFSEITIFEQRSSVGGIWNYVPCSEEAPTDLAVPQLNPHAGYDKPIWQNSHADKVINSQTKESAAFLTPLYDRLETNIPRGLMGFSDLDWDQSIQLFPKHQQVLDYIEKYAEDVRHLIQFKTQVLDVQSVGENRWNVKTQEVTRSIPSEAHESIYDAVIVASGHFNIPYIPSVKGMDEWHRAYPGTINHSKFYRKPEHYSGKKVVVIGNSASGIDIAGQIRQYCKTPLIQSSRSESYLQTETPADQTEKPEITEFVVDKRIVIFADGSQESDVDVVLYCTGYFYSFPFLDSLDPPVVTTGERAENLYQHTFYRSNPTLAFPVLNQKVIPFPMAEAQGAVIARVLSGRLALPSNQEMKQWEDDVISEMGDGRNFHVLKFPRDAEFINMLHDWAVSVDGGDLSDKTNGYARRRSVTSEEPGKTTVAGKKPPYWGEKEYWMRERFPAIKKAYQSFGDDRHNKRTLQDVGFDFDKWKEEKAEEGRRLL